jgi:glycine/serine hydroxymethyltransferase
MKPLKKRNNEIVIQYLTDSTVVKDEPPLVGLVGVSVYVRSDVKQMSKIAQDCPSVLIGKQL